MASGPGPGLSAPRVSAAEAVSGPAVQAATVAAAGRGPTCLRRRQRRRRRHRVSKRTFAARIDGHDGGGGGSGVGSGTAGPVRITCKVRYTLTQTTPSS